MTAACVSARRATIRATPLNSIQVFDVWMLVSYETIVAFRFGSQKARIVNSWGPTTGRHLKEGGAYDWPQYEVEEFNRMLNDAVYKSMSLRVAKELS
jgi:hypothetical protein